MSAIIQAFDIYIINPLLVLVYGAAFVMFVLGVIEFFIGLNRDEPSKKMAGKQHIVYGLIGIFVMVCAQGLIAVISNTVSGLTH